jgi:hypothetical protein
MLLHVSLVTQDYSDRFKLMILPILTLVLVIVIPVIKEFRCISRATTGQAWKWASKLFCSRVLHQFGNSSAIQAAPWDLKWALFHRPLLVLFFLLPRHWQRLGIPRFRRYVISCLNLFRIRDADERVNRLNLEKIITFYRYCGLISGLSGV